MDEKWNASSKMLVVSILSRGRANNNLLAVTFFYPHELTKKKLLAFLDQTHWAE